MSHALIISDSVYISSLLGASFIAAGLQYEHIHLHTLFGMGSQSGWQHRFALLHVDKEAAKRFSGVLDELSAVIKNCASHLPLYLSFEDSYDNRFYWWRLRAKRFFEQVNDEEKIQAMLVEINKLESAQHNPQACVSPTGLV